MAAVAGAATRLGDVIAHKQIYKQLKFIFKTDK